MEVRIRGSDTSEESDLGRILRKGNVVKQEGSTQHTPTALRAGIRTIRRRTGSYLKLLPVQKEL